VKNLDNTLIRLDGTSISYDVAPSSVNITGLSRIQITWVQGSACDVNRDASLTRKRINNLPTTHLRDHRHAKMAYRVAIQHEAV
jgi:hypothetical protein